MKRITLVIGAAAVAVSLTACNGSKSSTPAASVLATNTAAQAVKSDIKNCLPNTPAGQLSYANSLLSDTKLHRTGARQGLALCLGISKADEKPFINSALAALEASHPLTPAGRHKYFTVTLPGIIASFAKPSPSCTHVSNQGGNQGSSCASVTK